MKVEVVKVLAEVLAGASWVAALGEPMRKSDRAFLVRVLLPLKVKVP
jgi:hypothetical protein